MSARIPLPASAPVRTCVGCRERADRSDLLRLVVSGGRPEDPDHPSGSAVLVVPDPRVRNPGRGAWIHPRRSCLEQAEKRRAFGRAFRRTGPFELSAVIAYLEREPQQ